MTSAPAPVAAIPETGAAAPMIPAAPRRHGLRWQTKAGFGIAQIAGQLFRDAPSLLLLFYLTTILGLRPDIAGLAIFVPKVFFGAAFDMGVGMLSDRLAGRFARRGWLLIGGIAAPFAMLASFAIPQMETGAMVVWVFASFSIYMAVFSTFSVPYLAQFASMTEDPAERTELMGWRHGFTGVGVLLGSAGVPVLIHALGGGRFAYVTAAAVLGAICSATLVVGWWHARAIPEPRTIARPLALADLPKVLKDRRYMALCASAVVMTIAAGISYASFAFFVTYAMKRADAFVQIGILSTIMAAVVMAGSPFWVGVANRLGKKNTYLLAAIGHGAVMMLWSFAVDLPMWGAYVLAAGLGLCNTGWGVMVLSMLSDAIANARDTMGEDRAGTYSAIWSIIEKAGIAFGGTLVVGNILAWSGFDAAAAKAGVPQSQAAINGIIFAYTVLPGVAKWCAAALVWFCIPADKPRISQEIEA
ncbi:MFS transporter [Novosphingobium sp. FSY-8]|uniref:MFS transporter n=1 Tax=Novosphingobium ovatum TaxID=1908523 RepID=A0ABW9XBV3_9SPHN|nr:MFS transporter [Novosphingobium ovatum]NBC35977.1 MFS transporter [Novosphingobium ovatum]